MSCKIFVDTLLSKHVPVRFEKRSTNLKFLIDRAWNNGILQCSGVFKTSQATTGRLDSTLRSLARVKFKMPSSFQQQWY